MINTHYPIGKIESIHTDHKRPVKILWKFQLEIQQAYIIFLRKAELQSCQDALSQTESPEVLLTTSGLFHRALYLKDAASWAPLR